MLTTLGLSQPVINLFDDERDKAEFALLNNYVWNRIELLYIQENEVDINHLLSVYQQYMSHLRRCIEMLESIKPTNESKKNSFTTNGNPSASTFSLQLE